MLTLTNYLNNLFNIEHFRISVRNEFSVSSRELSLQLKIPVKLRYALDRTERVYFSSPSQVNEIDRMSFIELNAF